MTTIGFAQDAVPTIVLSEVPPGLVMGRAANAAPSLVEGTRNTPDSPPTAPSLVSNSRGARGATLAKHLASLLDVPHSVTAYAVMTSGARNEDFTVEEVRALYNVIDSFKDNLEGLNAQW